MRAKRTRAILSPFFIGRDDRGLESLAGGFAWQINKPSLPSTDPMSRMGVIYGQLADMVSEALRTGHCAVSVSGDCLSSIGMLAGVRRAGINPSTIWFDAHGDFHTWETTASSFLGGMPLAMLTGRGDQTLLEAVGLSPIPDEQVILMDARSLDAGEAEALAASRIKLVRDVNELLKHELPSGPLHVHVDTDIIDPRDAPAMTFPVPNGPRKDELARVMRRLAESGRIIAVSLSAWNSKLDCDGRSRDASMGLLRALTAYYTRAILTLWDYGVLYQVVETLYSLSEGVLY